MLTGSSWVHCINRFKSITQIVFLPPVACKEGCFTLEWSWERRSSACKLSGEMEHRTWGHGYARWFSYIGQLVGEGQCFDWMWMRHCQQHQGTGESSEVGSNLSKVGKTKLQKISVCGHHATMQQQRHWPTLEKRRKQARLTTFYKFHHSLIHIESRHCPSKSDHPRRQWWNVSSR